MTEAEKYVVQAVDAAASKVAAKAMLLLLGLGLDVPTERLDRWMAEFQDAVKAGSEASKALQAILAEVE